MAAAVAVSALLLAAIGVASVSMVEALEERRSAVAASELKLAAITVASSEILLAEGQRLPAEEVRSSVAELRSNHDLALHSLDSVDAARARLLLSDVEADGLRLLEPGDRGDDRHDHLELQELLGVASRRANADASEAEQKAWIAMAGALLALAFGGGLLIRTRFRSVRARTAATARERAGQRLEALLNDSPDMFFVIDGGGDVTYRSASSWRLLDSEPCTREDIVALAETSKRGALREHLQSDESHRSAVVFEMFDVDGNIGCFELRVSDLSGDDVVDGHVVTIRDITGEVQLRQELRQQAMTDVLTGLPNRRSLQPAIDRARESLAEAPSTMAMVTLDIDGFKDINDTLGHIAGDELLTTVAARLSRVVEHDETLLRLGGDEFAMIIPSVSGDAAALMAAQRLVGALEGPFRVGDRTERVRTSIGVAVTAEADHAQALISEADIALYEAKRRGGETVVLYEAELQSLATRSTQITRALREADHDTEFSVVYQPIVDAHSTEIVSLEALLRWTSPTLGAVTPDEFIPVAEVSGEICAIGAWVLDEVCRQLAVWSESGVASHLNVSVNVSPRQLAEPTYTSQVLSAAHAWSVDPHRLGIEVTESAALDRAGVACDRLAELRSAGIRISIDDFGSGYSNLKQLLSIPFDIIKIDRSLLLTLTDMRARAGGDSSGSCAIMEAIVSIAGVLHAPVVCEGVETEEQLTSLQASGISHVQGYLTGRPSPPTAIEALLAPVAPTSVATMAPSD